MKKILIFIYSICVIVGFFIGYFAIDLRQANAERPVVNVKVNAAEPVIIRDTVTQIEVKYKYVYKNRCCCEFCIIDTVR